MAAEHGVDGQGAGERAVGDLVADGVAGVAQQQAQELAQLRLAHQAQAQGEATQCRCLPPAAFGQARRRGEQHGRQHAGEAGEAVAQGGVGGGIGVRPAVGEAGLAAGRDRVAAIGRERGGGQVGGGELEAVGRKVQLLHDRGAEIVQQVRQLRRAQAGGDVDGARGTAHGLGLLDHQDLAAGLGQGGGGDQAVVAGADDDGVEGRSCRPARCAPCRGRAGSRGRRWRRGRP